MVELYRKVQAGVLEAAQFGVPEWNMLGKLEKFDVDWSAREITVELDINDDYGTASIVEGGKEARPSSVSVETATLTWILLNNRFTRSLTAKYIQQGTPRALLMNQLKFQGKKAVQGIRRKCGDMFYGFSTGILCDISSVATDTITLKNMYGVSGEGAAADARQCSDLFRAGDYIAVLNPTGPALRANGIVLVDSVSTTNNTITGSAVSDITSPTAEDYIVMANSLENTTLAGGTEYNLNFVGLLDACTSTSIHSLSGDTYPKWTAGFADTGGGRMTGIKLRKMKQGINNSGGGTLNTVLWSQGVENDVVAQLQAGLRFSDAFNMEMDGQAKSKGVTFMASRFTPDGWVFGFDKKSVKKMTLLPEPSAPGEGAGDKLQDDSGEVFSLDYPAAMVYTNRGNLGYLSGVTEQ